MNKKEYNKFELYGFIIIAILFFIAIVLIIRLINLLPTYSLVTG